MKSRTILFISIFTAFNLIYSRGFYTFAKEVKTPTFPECDNPQGTIKVSYDEGIHGIPGSSKTYSGSDEVYILSGDTLAQCFCAVNGDGIQTNWWRVSSLGIGQIDLLIAQGWVYIPDGSIWGLQEAPYVAFNSEFDCWGDGDDHGDENDGDDDDDRNKKDEKRIGSVLGIGGVLGLATTGNAPILYFFLGTGLISATLLSAVLLTNKKKK